MEAISYSQVEGLIKRIPEAMLPLAYHLLQELTDKDTAELPSQADLMHLPLEERRRIMMRQSERMIAHYEQTEDERTEWQSGNFIGEH